MYADFADSIYDENYLIIVDAFTNWSDVYAMPNLTVEATPSG